MCVTVHSVLHVENVNFCDIKSNETCPVFDKNVAKFLQLFLCKLNPLCILLFETCNWHANSDSLLVVLQPDDFTSEFFQLNLLFLKVTQ